MDLIDFSVWLITKQAQMAWLVVVCLGVGTFFALVFHGFPKGLLVYRGGDETRFPDIVNFNTFPKAEIRHRELFDFKNFNRWFKQDPDKAMRLMLTTAVIIIAILVVWSVVRMLI
jgi:hypothetical protein